MGLYNDTLGPVLIGTFFNTYLFGLVTNQFVTYYTSGFNDPWWIRIMVFIMAVTDTFYSIILIYMCWVYCVADFANPNLLQYNIWPYGITPIPTAVVALITHLFLGYRIYRLTGNKVLFGFISVFAVAVFIVCFVGGILLVMIPLMVEIAKLNKLAIGWVSLQVTLDWMILGILVIRLYTSRTSVRGTNIVIVRLIRAAIQTGTFGAIFAMLDVITLLTLPQTQFYAMFTFPIGRIYTNTLMATLNMREGLRGVLNQSEGVTIPLTTTVPQSQQQPSVFNPAKDIPQRQHDVFDAGVESRKVISVSNPGAPVQSQEQSVVIQETKIPLRQPNSALTDSSTSSSCDETAESREPISTPNPTTSTPQSQ